VTAVDSRPTACLRSCDGSLLCEDASWVSAATTADEHALRRVQAPVIDIGCGPGRHVVALAAPTVGFPTTVAAFTWVEDVLSPGR